MMDTLPIRLKILKKNIHVQWEHISPSNSYMTQVPLGQRLILKAPSKIAAVVFVSFIFGRK